MPHKQRHRIAKLRFSQMVAEPGIMENVAIMERGLLVKTGPGRFFGKSMLALACCGGIMAFGAGGASGQPQDAPPPPPTQNSLNIPQDVTLFGKSDPNIRKATAVINGEIITGTDVDQRLALIITANGGKVGDEEKDRLRLQVLRNLIDETLQIQEAKANDITVDQAEIEQSYARVAQNFGRNPEQFDEFLRTQGSSSASIKRQIEGELAWGRLLRRNVQPFVNVGEEEVQSIIDRLKAAKGEDEYRIGEIYLSATPDNASQIQGNARNIIQQIQQGGSFQAYARQFSEASTAAVGGDLGWVKLAQLPNELALAARDMQVGQIAGPVALPGGFSILYVMDKRKVLTSDPRDALLSLKQLSVVFPAGTTQAQASTKASEFASATRKIQGCGTANEIAAQIGADVVDNDQIRIRDLPLPLQDTLLNLQVGQASPPFGSVKDGVRVLVLCGRDDPQDAGAPSFEQIMAQLEDERVNKRARIYLRDLRRDAVIDYN
ncbi:peptidyl-prolyl cis-trans isomerase SurA [Rhizorhapis suberifaciens]|uniref:Parvulin-like PPIase n=2 Tax=Rhizorhapis suberifaciens TaxID=13656 RepID=A0A840HWA7_9SPHN|nr:peptidylprolyl isomerase [Rhizorhapis suberifaciens]MBB4642243.1 peptidyl-prolyl cis-trans isomerase SurA [Rhizorhapis suberifaciens]